MTTAPHRLVLALFTLAALFAVALAPAATGQRYSGKLKGAGPVSFSVSGSTVAGFRASTSVTCASSSGGQSETYLLAPATSAKLDARGSFTLTFSKAKQEGGPFPLYKIAASVRGKVKARSASGTLKVSYYKNALVAGRLTLMACASGTASWTARRA